MPPRGWPLFTLGYFSKMHILQFGARGLPDVHRRRADGETVAALTFTGRIEAPRETEHGRTGIVRSRRQGAS